MTQKSALSYDIGARPNPAALLAVACGSLLFIPLTGLLAIYFGRRGIVAARERGAGWERLARGGVLLGRANLVLTLLAAVVVPLGVVHQRRQAQVDACAANLQAIGQAILLYSNSNRGADPPTFDPLAGVVGVPSRPSMYLCPACVGDPTRKPATQGTAVKSHYVKAPTWRPKLPMRYYGTKPSKLVAVYEPLGNHDGRGSNVLFADRRVEWVAAPWATKMIAELESGQNPPPPLR